MKLGRLGLATALKEEFDFNERCEMAAKGDILTMSHSAPRALTKEISAKQPPLHHQAKFLLVVRALKDWRLKAVTKGIEAVIDKFWDIQSPSKLGADAEEHVEFNVEQPRLRAVGGSTSERCGKMIDNLYDCIMCPLIADGENSVSVRTAICKKLTLKVDEVMQCDPNGELEDWGDTLVNMCSAMIGISVKDSKLTRECWLAAEHMEKTHSPLFSSIKAIPFWRDALAEYRRVLPATKKLQAPISAAVEELQGLPDPMAPQRVITIEKSMVQLTDAKNQQVRVGEYVDLETELGKR
ncbi:unnamed protein product, partial [Prorocentrum cordatum]